MIRRFARPYARAIVDVAGSPAKANELRGELMPFANALRSTKELQDLYASPAIHMDTKVAVTQQLARKMKVSDLAAKTLEVLTRNHRVGDLDAILEALAALVNSALGVAVAHVRSAKALSPEEIGELANTLSKRTGKKVELEIRTDPKLLGGFIVKIGSVVWDASVAGKINKFRESLT
jgi:F-type H+-transporting ATPase subunit delta